MTQTPDHQDSIYKGIASAVFAFFLLTLMNVFVKLLADDHNVIEIAFYRNIIPLLLLLLFVALSRRTEILKTHKPKAMLFRVCIGTIGLYATFTSVKLLPLSDATVLFFASTLMLPVIAFFVLDEHIGWRRWLAILVGFGGVILIARPSLDVQILGIAVALGAALCHAIVQVSLRYLKTEPSLTVTFYFMLGGAIISGLFMPWVAQMPTKIEMLYFIGLGLSGGSAQYFLTSAFRMAPATVISPFNYTGLIWATGFDILIWHYVPGWPVFIGAGIIVLSKLYIIHRERVTLKKSQAPVTNTANLPPQSL